MPTVVRRQLGANGQRKDGAKLCPPYVNKPANDFVYGLHGLIGSGL